MAPLSDTCYDALERELDRRQRQEHHLDPIAGGLPPAQHPKVGPSAQGAFKRKILVRRRQPVEFRQHKPSRPPRRQLRAKRRQSTGNQIGIHKVNHARFAEQELSRERRLPRAVRPGDHNAAGRLGRPPPHLGITSTRSPSLPLVHGRRSAQYVRWLPRYLPAGHLSYGHGFLQNPFTDA